MYTKLLCFIFSLFKIIKRQMWPCIPNHHKVDKNNFEIHAKMWWSGTLKCTHFGDSNNHYFTSQCAVKSKDMSFWSSQHKVSKFETKLVRGLLYERFKIHGHKFMIKSKEIMQREENIFSYTHIRKVVKYY